jgi:hypothetical protein
MRKSAQQLNATRRLSHSVWHRDPLITRILRRLGLGW